MNLTLVNNSSPVISKEEKEVLIDICNRCYFLNKKEKQGFIKQVCNHVNKVKLEEITEDEFPAAFEKAMAMLHKRGEDVFKPSKSKKSYYIESTKINFNGGF